MPESKAIKQLEDRMAGLEPGTLRRETLEAAKRFKSSWIELGRMLWTIWKEKRFREWGYLTFDAYCAKEVGIRPATAKKLLHSYYFLEKEEPTLLRKLTEETAPANLPNPDSVNLLRLLEKKQEVSPEGYQRVRSYVLEKGKEAPEVRREVRALLDAAQPDPAAARAARRQALIRRMIGTLKGLKMELASSNMLPKKLLAEVEAIARKLEESIEEEASP
ncbi:MAG: hypothetical protein HY211_02725 [Candidatus Omnitrophica bacterium]|nr:hypothetical protein [Candidatus Omnitrophota bacterium]